MDKEINYYEILHKLQIFESKVYDETSIKNLLLLSTGIKSYIFTIEELKNIFINNVKKFIEDTTKNNNYDEFRTFFKKYYIDPLTDNKEFVLPKNYPHFFYYPTVAYCRDIVNFANSINNIPNGIVDLYIQLLGNNTLHLMQGFSGSLKIIDYFVIIQFDTYTARNKFLQIDKVFEPKNFVYQYALLWLKSVINKILTDLYFYTLNLCHKLYDIDENLVYEVTEDDKQELTNREYEVYGLAIEGLSKKEIANKLQIAETTIQEHINNIGEKTGVRGLRKLSKLKRRNLAP